MKTPAFWQSRNLLSALLLAPSVLYDMLGTLRRAFITVQAVPVPLICIGNLTAGGAGKTPVALYVGQALKKRGVNAFFLSRGYGGSAKGPLLVDAYHHSACETGDEPLLLAKALPTVIAKDRLAGARFAAAQGAQAIIMDDGFQNPAIAKTLSLLVIDGATGFGNGRLIPAGPLRESPESGFARAHAVIVINPTQMTPHIPEGKPLLVAKTYPAPAMQALKGKKIVAFCGLALPQKFFGMLESCGALLMETHAFADHHPYSDADMRRLLKRAERHGAQLVTTAKDAVRLPAAAAAQVEAVGMELSFEKPELLDLLLSHALGRA